MSGEQMAEATAGRWLGDTIPAMVTGVGTDTRTFCDDDAFLALRGPNFDGHCFAEHVSDRASMLIGDPQGIPLWEGLAAAKLEVSDTCLAYADLATNWRRRMRAKIIALTGSCGKTSTREMLHCLFSSTNQKILATQGNENNLIGVPRTLLRATGEEDVLLVECGISERGEMSQLAEMVLPDIAVITNVAAGHIEGLGDLKGVLTEKLALAGSMAEGGWLVLGAGIDVSGHDLPEQTISMDDAHDVVKWQLHGRMLHLIKGHEEGVVELSLPASHWAENMALVATVATRCFSMSLQQVATGLANWRPPQGRMTLIAGACGSRIIDDSYNANPVSMQASLDTLAALPGAHYAILGDMKELGSASEAHHQSLMIPSLSGLILVGNQMRSLRSHYPQARWVEDAEGAIEAAKDWHLSATDYVLIKGSHSMRLEQVVAELEVKHAL
ncbi:MAG: UDP-N-acetylmuramoyl-tripeptide--D-alanyl-D-alanine ligase [Mariprofundaceae bacterium]